MTIESYLSGSINFDISEDAIKVILADRNIADNTNITNLTTKEKELCKADLYMWVVTSPNRRGSVSDSDNSWSHSDGGFSLTDADKKAYISMANAIYDKYNEDKKSKTTFKIVSFGSNSVKYKKNFI